MTRVSVIWGALITSQEEAWQCWVCFLWICFLSIFCVCVVSVPKPARTLKLDEYRADLIHLNRVLFLAIVFKSFDLGLQALCSALEQALPWPLHLLGTVYFIHSSELFFPSIHAKEDRKSCTSEHGKFQEENPYFAKALSAI